jgi:hypothetical protein
MKHSTGTPTKAEKARFDRMKEMGQCVACYQHGIHGRGYIEIHHLLSGNKRIGHLASVSLCPWHHQSTLMEGYTRAKMTALFGPSLANGSKPFRAEFGTDKELLDLQNALLGIK